MRNMASAELCRLFCEAIKQLNLVLVPCGNREPQPKDHRRQISRRQKFSD